MYTHTFRAVVGRQAQLDAAGKYVRYVGASAGMANPKIRIKTDKQHEVDLLPGQAVTLPERVSTFKIGNVDGIADIVGTLMIGDGAMTDDRVNGEVLNIDGSYSRSVAQVAYVTNHNAGPTAAQYTQLQLWNPVGSGKILVCHAIRMATQVAGVQVLRLQDHNAAFGTLIGTAKSRYLGAAPGGVLAEVRQTANAAILGTELFYFAIDQDGIDLQFADPFVIPPGRGLSAVCATVNIGMHGSFDHFWIPST